MSKRCLHGSSIQEAERVDAAEAELTQLREQLEGV